LATEPLEDTPAPTEEGADKAFSTEPPAIPFRGSVVGIGASAGGLDALERFFSALPTDSGAAFVVIQHLSPDHKSMMDNLLARYTAMPVRVVEHEMPLAPNAVFLIPPGKHLRLAADRLLLSPKAEHGLSLPIDIFFNSLAEQWADGGIAVVLSGTGSDGSRGLAAVNAAGGFVFVQDPTTAKFDGMPRSAIGTGLVDVVAPAEDLARRLLAHLRAPREAAMRLVGGELASAQMQPLDAILERLVASSGIDFREYKPTTVLRRIERRMQVLHASSLADYHERLSASPDEQSMLRRELLIPVTRFFRDIDAFEQLAEQVLPDLVQTNSIEPIRVWVACCATGEEAYSIAILFAEAFQRLAPGQPRRPVKVFATDVEQQYLDQAAAGTYPDTIAAEVSARRLEQFFAGRQGSFVVRPEIRQMVIFARHNLVGDPPFTRMDLVSCRNALIYFQPVAQERALRRLQYALVAGGHLLLGPSESLGVMHRDFVPLPGRHKVYKLLRHDRTAMSMDVTTRHVSTAHRQAARRGAAPVAVPGEATPWVTLGQRQLLQSYVPPTLLVGAARELLHVYGTAGDLLQFGDGQATLDVLKLLPRELAWAAGLLLQAVAAERRPQSSAALRLGEGEAARRVRLTARPVSAGGDDPAGAPLPGTPGLVLLSLETVDLASMAVAADMTQLDEAQQRRVEALERELDITHDSLQATIEELETANEELQATNEELMASNEELQSTNEELQSVNEELYTVNSEFQAKVDVLNSVNADLENIAKATAIPTLFVDSTLRLTRFTPELAQLFKVREGDRGRSIEDFAHTLDYPELFADLRRTLAGGSVTEREVKSRDGQWWLARIQPYSSRAAGSSRAVMTFVNVTSLKDSQRLQAVVDSLVEHVAVVDLQGNITLVNAAWRQFAASNGDDGMQASGPGSNYLRVCEQAALHDADARRAHDGLLAVLQGRQPLFTMQYPCHTAEQQKWFVMHVAPVAHPTGGAVVSHIDVTAWAGHTAAPISGNESPGTTSGADEAPARATPTEETPR
jgi:two-component system CheB/CheR fusion protein